jgi:MipA family protein
LHACPDRPVLDRHHRCGPTHRGQREVGFDYRGIAFEPDIGWGARSAGGWGYGVNLGLMVGTQRLAHTFYGVAPEFVTPTRPLYEAKAGLISTRLTFNLGTSLSPDWRFFAFARFDTVKGAANRSSPLVDKPTGASAGVGLAWTGWRSDSLGTP